MTAASLELARAAIPAYRRTGDRAVTPADYEHLAVKYRTTADRQLVTRCVAIQNGAGPGTILLACVGPDGAQPGASELSEIETYFNGSMRGPQRVGGVGLANVIVVARAYTPYSLSVVAHVEVEPGYAVGVVEELRSVLAARLAPLSLRLIRDEDGNLVTSTEYAWQFGGKVPLSFIRAEIITSTDRIVDLELSSPSATIQLASDELPNAPKASITITVSETA